ncbi:MAG: 50S ribosomal protein L23 [Candidatus Zambryskibacteria bacterium]|nr:50S ribosomal protein L23 [Candidatus Zambryskibacteria bacterium]
MLNLNLKAKNVLLRPRITEKAALSADKNNTYVFEVASKATKSSIAASVRAAYKVIPVKVRVANIPDKAVFIRGKKGVKRGGKKAYVYLKKGDKIELL